MDYRIVNRININRARCEKFGAFLYDREIDGLYIDMPWWFPVQLGFSHGLTVCEVTPMFLRLPFLFKGWVNEQILLRLAKLLKLAMSGKVLMHASCVDSTLIVGFPNSGKTYQTYKSVSEGGKLISEEYTVIYQNDKKIWVAAPFERVMRTCFSGTTMKHCGIKTSLREKIWLFSSTIRATLFPFMYEAVIWKNIPVSGATSPITKIVYGSSGKEIKDWKQFAILCENEFPFMASEFLQAYALASGLDLLAIQETQRKLIKEFVESVYPRHRK
jgi:hypothetical protein